MVQVAHAALTPQGPLGVCCAEFYPAAGPFLATGAFASDFAQLRAREQLSKIRRQCGKEQLWAQASYVGAAGNVSAKVIRRCIQGCPHDILYCDILRHEGRTVDKHSKWPFRETREGLIGALNGRQPQDALRDAVVDLIVDSLQTYRGGRGDDLYALHDLNIEDKHMLLLPTININNVQGVEFVGADGTVGTFGGSSFGGDFSGTGAHSRIEAATDIVEIVNFGSAALDLRFGTKTFHGQPVVPTLHRISRLVSTTVETVEKCLNPA